MCVCGFFLAKKKKIKIKGVIVKASGLLLTVLAAQFCRHEVFRAALSDRRVSACGLREGRQGSGERRRAGDVF